MSSGTRSSVSGTKKQSSRKRVTGKQSDPSVSKSSRSTSATKHTRRVSSTQTTRPKRQTAKGSKNSASAKAAPSHETKKSAFTELKRSRSKAKAEKAFTKQFAGKESSNASGEGAPRAALYKTEMGKSHKRATKAVENGKSSSSGKSKVARPTLRNKINSPRARTAIVVALCLIVVCVFLYPSAQQYYVTNREYAQLQAEYEALQQRNQIIGSEIDTLMTDEGVEDRARREFGWVKPGESSIDVYGLTENEEQQFNYTKSVPTGSVSAPETWYSPILDFIFNVQA